MRKKMNVADVINYYASRNILIEVMPDMYKTEVGLMWACNVYWKEGEDWVSEDMGFLPDWELIFYTTVDWIENYINTNSKKEDIPNRYLESRRDLLSMIRIN